MRRSGVRGHFRLPSTLDSVILDLMVQDLNSSAPIALFNRGPMDGQEHPTEGDTSEVCVVMSDGQQHRYRRTEELQPLPDGRVAVVFDWAGRYYGPK